MSDENNDFKSAASALALDVWNDLAPTIPDIIRSVTAQTEVVLQGQYKDATAAIFRKMSDDLVAFKNKEIDRIELEDILQRRKAAIFALYNANKISHQKPSIQKILSAVENIVTTILVKAIPVLIAASL